MFYFFCSELYKKLIGFLYTHTHTKSHTHTTTYTQTDMSKPITYFDARHILHYVLAICEGILLRAGPFHKEGIYQLLLIHELTKRKIVAVKERSFNLSFKDSDGNNVYIGDNHTFRTDIELPEMGGILELKSSEGNTKENNIWQLRNYLEQRPDCHWGIVINFISKFGTRTSPKVQCDLVFQVDKDVYERETVAAKERETTHTSSPKIVCVNSDCAAELTVRGTSISKVWTESIVSHNYPLREDVFFNYEKAIVYNRESTQSGGTMDTTNETDD